MTAARWVRRARFRLALLGAARAFAWAGAVLLVGLALASLLGRPELRLAAWIAALGTLAVLVWRERFVWSPGRVALWLEERLPELRYALVTAVDTRYAASFAPRIEPLLRGIDPGPVMRRAAQRSVLPPVLALALAALAFLGAGPPSSGLLGDLGAAEREAEDMPSRLEPLGATLAPPSYAQAAGVEPRTLEEPTTIEALAGSTVRIQGPGGPDGLGVTLGDSALAATAGGGHGWQVTFTLPDSANVLVLEDREHRRLIVLAPVRDRPPTVQLILPERDTTVREPAGTLRLDARITDDIALAGAHFEYIVASGENEGEFTFREGVVGPLRIEKPAVRDRRHRLTLPLAHFDLKPGDQLTLRAVSTDNNDWNGPGIGYSEPRTLRVARPGEYDSLAVDPAPPPADSMLMTLRWLIELVERLEADRDKLPRSLFVDSSRAFGGRVDRMRYRVGQLQSDVTMGGLLAPNPLLDTAYQALLQGATALKVAEPGESLPHLWDALKALQKYAWAERYYLRGRSPEVLVDLARVRLAGKDTGYASPRMPRGLADTTRIRLRKSYEEAFALLETAPNRAHERLALIQVEALGPHPALAAALGTAVAALQTGRDAAPALERARRILDGPAAVTDTLSAWSGVWR